MSEQHDILKDYIKEYGMERMLTELRDIVYLEYVQNKNEEYLRLLWDNLYHTVSEYQTRNKEEDRWEDDGGS